MASPARTAMIPWQDSLGLDGRHRMNTPGTTVGNWTWRFDWEQLPKGLTDNIRACLAHYDRLPATLAATTAEQTA